MSKDKRCQCKTCVRNNRLAKIAKRRKISRKDQKFLLEILEQLNNAEGYLELSEYTVHQIKESGCLDSGGYINYIRQGVRKEKDMLNQLWDDLFAAKKTRDGAKTNLLSTLIAEIQAIGKNDGNRLTTETEAVAVVKKFLKNVEITIGSLREKSPESQHLSGLVMEKELLESYLPKQLSESELKEIITNMIQSMEDKSPKQMGKVMSELKQSYNGQYDGKTASTMVKEMLN